MDVASFDIRLLLCTGIDKLFFGGAWGVPLFDPTALVGDVGSCVKGGFKDYLTLWVCAIIFFLQPDIFLEVCLSCSLVGPSLLVVCYDSLLFCFFLVLFCFIFNLGNYVGKCVDNFPSCVRVESSILDDLEQCHAVWAEKIVGHVGGEYLRFYGGYNVSICLGTSISPWASTI
jgi:hypothetical protein